MELPKGPSHPCCNSRSSPTTRLHLRESRRVPPTSRGAPFPPSSSRGGILSLRVRERIPGVPIASQEEALSTGKARRTQGSCHHFQSRPDVSVHSRETCIPCTALTFKPRIDSHHGGTWDSPVGKPRGKATDPLIHTKGRVTLLLLLGRKALLRPPIETRTECTGETTEVPQDPCQHWREILKFRHPLHTRS